MKRPLRNRYLSGRRELGVFHSCLHGWLPMRYGLKFSTITIGKWPYHRDFWTNKRGVDSQEGNKEQQTSLRSLLLEVQSPQGSFTSRTSCGYRIRIRSYTRKQPWAATCFPFFIEEARRRSIPLPLPQQDLGFPPLVLVLKWNLGPQYSFPGYTFDSSDSELAPILI